MSEFYLYDRWDNRLRALSDVRGAIHDQEINGLESLTITTDTPLSKGERIVWCDLRGVWHEHVVDSPEDYRDDEVPLCVAYCEDSLNELFRDKVDEKKVSSATSSVALRAILEQTRWQLGTVTVAGTHTKTFSYCSAGEALKELVETWGGEVYSGYTIDANKITKRSVNLVARRGSDTNKRFEYSKDLIHVTRVIEPGDVYTAMRGFGKSEKVEKESSKGRLSFSSINGGKDYVEDTTARNLWGRPDGQGGKAHSFGTVFFNECENAAELKRLTQAELNKSKEPAISYTCGVIDLEAMGFDYEGVSIGDGVTIIDTTFEPALRLQGRVMAISRDLMDATNTIVTIGNIRKTSASEQAHLKSTLSGMERKSGNWDVAAYTPSSYINQVMDGLNKEFDAGNSYIYQSPTQGITVGSVPLDPETGKPTRTPASAIQLKGGGFRIASTVKSDGTFNWRTFGTGAGFTADEIISGVIRGKSNYWNLNTGDLLFKQGSIASTDGSSSWNLSTGDLTLSKGSIRSSDWSNSWNLSNGNLTLGKGVIRSSDGRNRWDLSNGNITLSDGSISNYNGGSSWNLKTGNIVLNNANLTGEFSCGSHLKLEMKDGKILGFNGTQEVMKLCATNRYESGVYGVSLDSPYYIVLRAPKLAVATNPTDNGINGGSGILHYVRSIRALPNGGIEWTTSTAEFRNGLMVTDLG